MRRIQNSRFICLITLFEGNEKIRQKQRIIDLIFNYCYFDFDKTIRSTLKYHAVPYGPNYSYYNSVFFDVYKRVFKRSTFEKKIRHFDRTRVFRAWLMAVIRNEVKDWLKSVDPESGMSQKEKIRLINKFDSSDNKKTATVDKAISNAADPLSDDYDPLAEPDGRTTSSKLEKCFQRSVDLLPLGEKAVIYIDLVAYRLPPQEIVTYISDRTQTPVVKLEAELNVLQETLRSSPRFAENEYKIKKLNVLYFRAGVIEKRLHFLRQELEGLGIVDIIALEHQAESRSSQKDANLFVEQRRRDFQHMSDCTSRDKENATNELKKANYIRELVYNRENTKKRTKLINALNNGDFFIRPSSKQTAQILAVTETVINTRRSRARPVLYNNYRECMQN
jgi:hypothetical protein